MDCPLYSYDPITGFTMEWEQFSKLFKHSINPKGFLTKQELIDFSKENVPSELWPLWPDAQRLIWCPTDLRSLPNNRLYAILEDYEYIHDRVRIYKLEQHFKTQDEAYKKALELL